MSLDNVMRSWSSLDIHGNKDLWKAGGLFRIRETERCIQCFTPCHSPNVPQLSDQAHLGLLLIPREARWHLIFCKFQSTSARCSKYIQGGKKTKEEEEGWRRRSRRKKEGSRSRENEEEEQLVDLSREEFQLTHRAWVGGRGSTGSRFHHHLWQKGVPSANWCHSQWCPAPATWGSNEINSSFYQNPCPGLLQTSGPTTLFSEWYSNFTQPATKSKKHDSSLVIDGFL